MAGLQVVAMSSVMQLSTFTKITSIPSEKNYSDFPVTVRVKVPEMTLHQHAPVDIIAVIDISGSMGYGASGTTKNRLDLVKNAMEKVIKNLGDAQNRLAIVAFDQTVEQATPLVAMTDEGQRSISEKVKKLHPMGGTDFSPALNKAAKILDERGAAEKDRLAFIIFLSDGDAMFSKESIQPKYPIHAFGFSADHNASALQTMAEVTSGSYTPINQDLEKIAEKLDQLSDKLTSIVAVDTRVSLKSLHPGVSLSKIESSADDDAGDSYKSQISDDKQSGEIGLGAISSGKEREFTVYLDVPEGQGNGADGAMQLLMVGGGYRQSWDQKKIALGESVVIVARPVSSSGCDCKELDWIEERLEYWCKVKQDLSAMYDKAEAEAKAPAAGSNDGKRKCQCQVTKALHEASVEAINRAMHHDIYIAVVDAIRLRHCSNGGMAGAVAAATENAPSPPPQAAKAV